MTAYLRTLRSNVRFVAAVLSALVAACGFATAYSDYLPATRGYAKDVSKRGTDSALMVATARIGSLQRESTETRLQLNQIRREGLRAAKWSRSEQLKSTTDPAAREIIQQQLDQITDDLKDVDDERDRLRIPSP